ncbi:MAG: VOC family protein [Firmicutes bacterium]|nr:VOC family protein [Bacillota bacterium]
MFEMPKIGLTPFLTFNGCAEDAMNFYVKSFPGAKIEHISRYEKGTPGADEGTVMSGTLSFNGGQISFLDMSKDFPAPPFNWSSSLLITCEDEAMFDLIFENLSIGGSVMMGPESVGEIRKCAWVVDKFGVVWQPVWK